MVLIRTMSFAIVPHMDQLRKRLAKTIKQKRGKMTEREFARKVGLSKTTLHRIENQDQNVTLDTLEYLCKKFKCDISDLFAR